MSNARLCACLEIVPCLTSYHRASRCHVLCAVMPEFFFGLAKLDSELLDPCDQARHLCVKLLNLGIVF